MNPASVTVDAKLLPYLRRGVRRELSDTLAILAFQLDTALDLTTYHDTLAKFDEARALFDAVGVADEPTQIDLELDACRWPRLLLRVLESQYDIEMMRLQDRAAEGFGVPLREMPALRDLVSDVREKVGAPSKGGGKDSMRQLARRMRRGRGDG